MARIAFFTETLPPAGGLIDRFAWEMIRSLADQNHDIQVFTTYDPALEEPASHPRMQILRPFRNWGLLELTRVAPILMTHRPEVIHVVQPHGRSLQGLSNAMNFLPSLLPVIGRPPILTSFFDVDEKLLTRLKPLLGSSDALTASNQSQARVLRDFFSKREPPQLEIVPLSYGPLAKDHMKTPASRVQDFAKTVREFVCVPGPLDQHVDVRESFKTLAHLLRKSPTIGAVVTGGWGDVSIRSRRQAEDVLYEFEIASRVLFTGPLTLDETRDVMRASLCVLLSPLLETRLSFTETLRLSQTEAVPLILSHEQAELDPIGWRDGDNSLIRARAQDQLTEAVLSIVNNDELRDRLRFNVAELSRTEVSDSPSNIVSRLYSKLLALH